MTSREQRPQVGAHRHRPSLPKWSLRTQMAGAVVLCLALFSVAAGLLTARAYRDDRHQAQDQLGRLAQAAAGELGTSIDQTQALLAGIAAQEAVAALDPGRCQPVLQGFSGIGEAHLVLADVGGRTLCSSLPAAVPGGDDYAGASWLAQVRAAQGPVHSEPWLDPVTSRPSLVMAVPTPPGARPVTAALGVVLALDSLVPDLVGPLERSRGTVLVVLDAGRRTVLAGSQAGLAGRELEDVPFARRAASPEFEAAYPDGRRRIYHQATVPGLGWHVYAGLPTSVAFAPAREALEQAAFLAAVVFCVLAVLSFLLHRQVVRPARALTTAIVSGRDNPKAPPAPTRGPAELARIAVEFNALQEARARNEETLRATEELFRSAFDGAPVGSAILGFPRRVVRANPALCELLGVREEELIGQDLDAIVDPDDLVQAEELSRRVREGEQGPVRAEMRLRRRDGSVRVAEMSSSLIRDAAGVAVFTHAQYLDITERRDAEEAIRALNAESAERVAELAEARAELRRALVHFTQTQEEQRRLAAQAIHDHTIQAVTATLWSLDDLADSGDSSRRDVIDKARANLRHAVAAARSLIFELRPPLLDELGLPAAVEQQLVRLAEESGLRTSLESDLAGRLPTHLETLAFRTTEQALRNVRLHAHASSVTVRIAGGAGCLEVVVDDDGVALSQRGPDGHVGFVSMRETISMAGGNFSVGPGPAGGTRLSFSLPVEAAASGPAGSGLEG